VTYLSDLLADQAVYRHRDSAHQALSTRNDTPVTLPDNVATASQAEILLLDLLSSHQQPARTTLPVMPESSATALTQQLQEAQLGELAQVIVMWASQFNSNVGRRDVLAKLSAAVTLAAAAPLFGGLDPDQQKHVVRAIEQPDIFDEPGLRYCEQMVTNLRRQGDVLGPQLTLQSALGHRQLAHRLATVAPPAFRARAISVYAELTQLVGWLCFNAGDYRSASAYNDDARTSAHDAHNVELVTYTLCTMSHLATWQGRPRVGIDHAAAAAVWAEQTGSPKARAYAANVAARAYLADNQPDKCQDIFDHEWAVLSTFDPEAPTPAWWYFYDESFYWSTKTQFALKYEAPEVTIHAVDKSLALVDPANLHERAHRSLFRAEAFIQQQDINHATSIIGEVVGLTAVNPSGRIDQRINILRATLDPWRRTKPVRELDEALVAYRSPIGNGR
jgi:hypothetical protein